jgi:hypothetical protein
MPLLSKTTQNGCTGGIQPKHGKCTTIGSGTCKTSGPNQTWSDMYSLTQLAALQIPCTGPCPLNAWSIITLDWMPIVPFRIQLYIRVKWPPKAITCSSTNKAPQTQINSPVSSRKGRSEKKELIMPTNRRCSRKIIGQPKPKAYCLAR